MTVEADAREALLGKVGLARQRKKDGSKAALVSSLEQILLIY